MIGKILGGRYEILEKIGEGGMAIVYKAKCNLLNRYVAIKVLKDEFINDENFIRKFKRESQAAASLSHPNILGIYDVGTEDIDGKKVPYIVMEYIKGRTLKDIIREKGKLTVDETIFYSIQIAEALKDAHSNHIVHRDIKPQNIMITDDNRVKVTDFGIARAATASTLTTTSSVLGSVHYFSPEQARGGYTDETSDIYSLGIVMYEMVTGKLPYNGETPISIALKHIQDDIISPRDINSSISIQLESIILKCVQKRQSDRYPNISTLIKDLKDFKSLGKNTNMVDNMDNESPTILIPTINPEEEAKNNKVNNKPNNKPNKKTDKKNDGGTKVVLSAILLAFLLVSGMFFGYFKLKELLMVKEVAVPNIVGMEEEQAKEEIEELGLKFSIKSREKSEEYAAGEIIWQSIEPSTKVKEGYTIEVIISEGKDLVRVPSLINKSLEEAERLLEEKGLLIEITYRNSDTTPEGYIIKQEPEPFTSLESGSKVNVIVSQGEEVKKVIMINVKGLNIIDAQNRILSAGLEIGNVVPQPSDSVEKDIVIWQEYEQGTELETKTSVDLYVSTGPEKKPDTNKPGDNNSNGGGNNGSNNGTGNGANKEEKTITMEIPISSDGEEIEVKLVRKQNGKTEEIYKGNHSGNITLSIKGQIGAQIDVYFDGVHQPELTKKIK